MLERPNGLVSPKNFLPLWDQNSSQYHQESPSLNFVLSQFHLVGTPKYLPNIHFSLHIHFAYSFDLPADHFSMDLFTSWCRIFFKSSKSLSQVIPRPFHGNQRFINAFTWTRYWILFRATWIQLNPLHIMNFLHQTSSTSFDGLGPLACFHFRFTVKNMIGFLRRKISPSQWRYLHRTIQKQRECSTISMTRFEPTILVFQRVKTFLVLAARSLCSICISN
jgi:hypothetical protein